MLKFNSVVAETLLIPLYMKAKESERINPILTDKIAEDLVKKIPYNYSQFDNAKMSAIGCVVRCSYFDNVICRFIDKYNNTVVVNLGCGLDARYQRISPSCDTIFYEVDLPEVINLRHKLIPEQKNDLYIATSILETDWMDKLKMNHPNSRFIFVIEGVLMYFKESEIIEILHNITKRFEAGEIWFDILGEFLSKGKLKPDSLKGHKAEIRSGFSNPHLPEYWNPSLKLIEQKNYFKLNRNRWGAIGYILSISSNLAFKYGSLLGYCIV